jgi:hypothetical protein
MLLLAAALATIFSNEELVYFEHEAGRTPPPWTAVEWEQGALKFVDAHGRPAAPVRIAGHSVDGDILTLRLADGSERKLRRARPATCWAALLKDRHKADGQEDWHFARGLKLHDGGGRVTVAAEGARPAVLRMRNVVWPSGTNRPSLVLYIHTPDDPERAVSYAWADPQASRVGINLRWMQASCTIDGKEGETR